MFDVLVTTGAGNVPMGGSDIWVNNFLENVVIHLNYPIILLIDGRKPTGFKSSSIPCQFVFSKEAPDLVEPILRNARKIHYKKISKINVSKFQTIMNFRLTMNIVG